MFKLLILAGFSSVLFRLPYSHLAAQETVDDWNLEESNNPVIDIEALLQYSTQLINTGNFEESLDLLETSLDQIQAIGTVDQQARAFLNIGMIAVTLGDTEDGISYYLNALSLVDGEANYQALQSDVLSRLGNAYNYLHDYDQALQYYHRALEIQQRIADLEREAYTSTRLGQTYSYLAQYGEALRRYQRALEIQRNLGSSQEEAYTLHVMGTVMSQLGDSAAAINLHQESLSIFEQIDDLTGQAYALGSLGWAYYNLEEYETAIHFHQRALTIRQTLDDLKGQIFSWGGLGVAQAALGNYPAAIQLYQSQLTALEQVNNPRERSYVLVDLADARVALENYSTAFQTYHEALVIQQEINNREGEGRTLGRLGQFFNTQNQPELAIAFYKQSVNVRESIRDDIQSLSQSLQQSFTDSIADDYRALAGLLLDAGRILEAQEVIDLLKLQELDDYNLPNVTGTTETRQGLTLWQSERAILEQFAIAAIEPTDDGLTAFIQNPIIIEHIHKLQDNAQTQTLNPEQLNDLQDNLRQAGNVALLYPLVLEERLELILVTPDQLLRETVAVDQETLNSAIRSFRTDITNQFSRPFPHAQQLYQWLIAPIADELAAANVETILYAADEQLRYIPLAALHDGNQWLIQQFSINHITAASLTNFAPSNSVDFSILAGAFPNHQLEVDFGARHFIFEGLPYAQLEVRNLANLTNDISILLGQEFSRTAIEDRLSNYRIIHLATHAEFHSGHPNDSFILLGNGDRITLYDLDQWQLPNVDLVVLSACRTAVGGELGNGEEILGFGYQIQRTGANAAIASLWYVNDSGTQQLMNAFYAALQNGYSESEALQQAQTVLITGDISTLRADRPTEVVNNSFQEEPEQWRSRSTNLSHPYYWASFILIGNGL